MSKTKFEIGYYQFRPIFGKINDNLRKIISALSEVKANLIVLPELPFTGYNFRNREELLSLSEIPKKSATVEALTNLCKRKNFHIVTGFAEKHKEKIFNSALLIGAHGIISTYRKLHLFNEEKKIFDDGDIALNVTQIKEAKIGMMVCFDWAFPETARSLTINGADVICHPSNLVLDYCQKTMLTRSLENSIFTVTANRFGEERRPHGSIKFTGKSQITAPKGILIHRAPAQKSELCIAEINLEFSRNKMITPLNDILKDRRPGFYKAITK